MAAVRRNARRQFSTISRHSAISARSMQPIDAESAVTGAAAPYTPSLAAGGCHFHRHRRRGDRSRHRSAYAAAISSYFNDAAGNPVKRESSGLYSWMATLTPYYPDQATPCAGTQCTLSLVIFYRRTIARSVPVAGSGQEEIAAGARSPTESAAAT